MMIIDPFRYGGVIGPATIAFVEAKAAGDATYAGNDATFAGVNIGALGSARRVFVTIHSLSTTSPVSITGVTIGGIAATIHIVGSTLQTAASQYQTCAIASALVPAGTTATIVITRSVTTGGVAISTFRGTNISSGTPVDTQAGSFTAANGTVTPNVAADGIVLAAGNFINPVSYSGITIAYQDATFYSGACDQTPTSGPLGITCSGAGGTSGSPTRSLVAAAFR